MRDSDAGFHHQGSFYGFETCPECGKKVWITRNKTFDRHQMTRKRVLENNQEPDLQIVTCPMSNQFAG